MSSNHSEQHAEDELRRSVDPFFNPFIDVKKEEEILQEALKLQEKEQSPTKNTATTSVPSSLQKETLVIQNKPVQATVEPVAAQSTSTFQPISNDVVTNENRVPMATFDASLREPNLGSAAKDEGPIPVHTHKGHHGPDLFTLHKLRTHHPSAVETKAPIQQDDIMVIKETPQEPSVVSELKSAATTLKQAVVAEDAPRRAEDTDFLFFRPIKQVLTFFWREIKSVIRGMSW